MIFACGFSAALALLLAAGELLAPARGVDRVDQRLRALFLICLGLLILHGGLLADRLLDRIPWFFGWQSPGGFLLGPILYVSFRRALDTGAYWPSARVRALFCAPAAIAFGFALAGALEDAHETQRRIADFYHSRGTAYYVILAGFVHFAIYASLALAAAYRELGPGGPRSRRAGAAAFIGLLSLGVGLFGLAAILVGREAWLQITVGALAAAPPILYLALRSRPDLLNEWFEAARKNSAAPARLKPDEAARLAARLEALMQVDRLYRDESLTLPTLAARLELGVHAASELLNRHAGLGFFDYINRFRVQEAQQLLRERTDLSVLAIAYEVGFNSKSAFQRAFIKFTGQSPREYRKNGPAP